MVRDIQSCFNFILVNNPTNLKDRVIDTLTNCDSEPWFPHLTLDLTRDGWRRLNEKTGITGSTYGTARVILYDTKFPRKTIYTLDIQDTEGKTKDEVFVELLPEVISNKYNKSGVTFYSEEEFYANGRVHNEFLDCLSAAFDLIIKVPSLFETARHLVKSIHLIKPEDDDYDVSFSEPHIPFSIFISVPQKNTRINALRVAEAIVHEVMHLQLTLIENIVPLVIPGEELVYSPWKEEYRTPQGVLHAIYVFTVIRNLMIQIFNNSLTDDIKFHINERNEQIKNQILKIDNFINCLKLTEHGREFSKNLIAINLDPKLIA